jgi:hypothetical protein
MPTLLYYLDVSLYLYQSNMTFALHYFSSTYVMSLVRTNYLNMCI